MCLTKSKTVSNHAEFYTECKTLEEIAKKFHRKKLDTIENSLV